MLEKREIVGVSDEYSFLRHQVGMWRVKHPKQPLLGKEFVLMGWGRTPEIAEEMAAKEHNLSHYQHD